MRVGIPSPLIGLGTLSVRPRQCLSQLVNPESEITFVVCVPLPVVAWRYRPFPPDPSRLAIEEMWGPPLPPGTSSIAIFDSRNSG